MKRNKLIVIAGPTGVGKTELSILLAKKLSGEIISCDSMQVYRGMNIGTAKISKSEMCGIRHHLLDILSPSENFDITEFQKLAINAIENIYSRGNTPILTGGTGFYIQSVIRNVEFTEKVNSTYVEKLNLISETKDGKKIIQELVKNIDPKSYNCIHPNNVKKLIRALDFYNDNGFSIQDHNIEQRAKNARYAYKFILLTDDRDKLYERINKRVDKMINDGLIDEVKQLLKSGINFSKTAAQGIGYKEVISYLKNDITLSECIERIKTSSRHYAKRQLTWFKKVGDIEVITRSKFDNTEDIAEYIIQLLKRN